MSRLVRAALTGAFVLCVLGCGDSGAKVITPQDTKPAPKAVTAGGGAPAKPKMPSKVPE